MLLKEAEKRLFRYRFNREPAHNKLHFTKHFFHLTYLSVYPNTNFMKLLLYAIPFLVIGCKKELSPLTVKSQPAYLAIKQYNCRDLFASHTWQLPEI